MSPEEAAKLFAIGQFSGEMRAISHTLTRLMAELREISTSDDILNSLIIVRRNVVETSVLINAWAEEVSKIRGD